MGAVVSASHVRHRRDEHLHGTGDVCGRSNDLVFLQQLIVLVQRDGRLLQWRRRGLCQVRVDHDLLRRLLHGAAIQVHPGSSMHSRMRHVCRGVLRGRDLFLWPDPSRLTGDKAATDRSVWAPALRCPLPAGPHAASAAVPGAPPHGSPCSGRGVEVLDSRGLAGSLFDEPHGLLDRVVDRAFVNVLGRVDELLEPVQQ